MAFISEINFEGSDAATEWVEVALGPDDDPNDFVVSVYRDNGTLHTGAGILFGELNLGDLTFAPTVSVVPDPDDPGWTIYQIPVGIKTAGSDNDEGTGIALTDISAGGGVVDFYSGADAPPITATSGSAAGATSDNSLDYRILEAGAQSVQWDYLGNRYNDDLTPGDALLADVVGTPPASDGTPSISFHESIFLGTLTDADTNESNQAIENTGPYLGSFGSPQDPLWQNELTVSFHDANGDGAMTSDNWGLTPEDEITYDLGSGSETAAIDSVAIVSLTVTYTDGSTQTYTDALMYQDTAGNMFLANSDAAGTDLNSDAGFAVQSIDVTSVSNVIWIGFAQDTLQDFVCFAAGTRIVTVSGDRPIEDLVEGDLVLTMDRGYQPIRWIGSSKRPATGDLAPILIRRGALGNDRDLRVSPQHRMLLQGWQAEMLFGEQEVLATAKSLVNDHSILRDEGGEVEYFHMLFDTHEIIYAEGAPSESFHPGEQGWNALDQATRDEILTLFPELADGSFEDYGASARTSLKHKEGALLGSYIVGS